MEYTDEELAGLSEEEKEGLLETDDKGSVDDTNKGEAGDAGKPGEVDEGDAGAEKEAAAAKEVDDKGVKIEADATKEADKDKGGVQDEDEEEVIDVSTTVKAVPLVDKETAQARIVEITEEVKAVHGKLADIKTQYDEGKIDVDEYDTLKEAVYAEEKVLEKEQTTLEVTMKVSDGMQQSAVQTQWVGAQEHYLGIHPEVGNDERIRKLFAEEVNTILQSEDGATMGNYDILKKAYKEISYLIPLRNKGETPEAQKIRLVAAAKKIAADKAKGKAPLTLKDVGAAEENISSAGKFAYLDKLEGAALEEAMGKMSEADMAAYAKEK